jgi:hypothetical protein
MIVHVGDVVKLNDKFVKDTDGFDSTVNQTKGYHVIDMNDEIIEVVDDRANNRMISIKLVEDVRPSSDDENPVKKKCDKVCCQESTEEKGVKFDSEKTCLELFPPVALEEISKVLTFGKKKYGAHNWAKGIEWSRVIGACMRHLNAWRAGQDVDSETGLSHIAHAGCCIAFLLHYEKYNRDMDDRYVPESLKKDEETVQMVGKPLD